MTPVRAALGAGSHAAAVEVNRARAGEGVSAQMYGLRSKILEVDVRRVPVEMCHRRTVVSKLGVASSVPSGSSIRSRRFGGHRAVCVLVAGCSLLPALHGVAVSRRLSVVVGFYRVV
jgi:hypothetical protein